jgi:8-oxo-dGTP diphosphatase
VDYRSYDTRLAAYAVVVDDRGQILLALWNEGPEPRWTMPGGGVELEETPQQATVRELREETGYDVEPVTFLGVWMDEYGGDSTAHTTLNLFWTARVTGGEPAPADDVSELGWFAADELPTDDELAFACIGLALAAWRQQHT